MITDCSKDYMTGKVMLVFEGETPTDTEIDTYCLKNYGFSPKSTMLIEPNIGFGGYPNPGKIYCHPRCNYFQE
jgi:hypothetical protein